MPIYISWARRSAWKVTGARPMRGTSRSTSGSGDSSVITNGSAKLKGSTWNCSESYIRSCENGLRTTSLKLTLYCGPAFPRPCGLVQEKRENQARIELNLKSGGVVMAKRWLKLGCTRPPHLPLCPANQHDQCIVAII